MKKKDKIVGTKGQQIWKHLLFLAAWETSSYNTTWISKTRKTACVLHLKFPDHFFPYKLLVGQCVTYLTCTVLDYAFVNPAILYWMICYLIGHSRGEPSICETVFIKSWWLMSERQKTKILFIILLAKHGLLRREGLTSNLLLWVDIGLEINLNEISCFSYLQLTCFHIFTLQLVKDEKRLI